MTLYDVGIGMITSLALASFILGMFCGAFLLYAWRERTDTDAHRRRNMPR